MVSRQDGEQLNMADDSRKCPRRRLRELRFSAPSAHPLRRKERVHDGPALRLQRVQAKAPLNGKREMEL
jgi:hypothetical protein